MTMAQKKDTELKIIESLHNHDLGHEIHNIHAGWNDNPSKLRPCHTCNGPHFIKDCDKTMCLMCKPNDDDHTPSKCPRKSHSNWYHNHSAPTKETL